MTKKLPLLGNLTAKKFLRDYWQKKPLLIRDAVPAFTGLLPVKDLLRLACTDDVQVRLVQREGKQWDVQHGPFSPSYLKRLPAKNWTLLVQELNHHLPKAAALLQQFAFIPHARLDDLMVSYAPAGGGVGAHMDSYDVFLLQGEGQRRWEISAQQDLSLVPDAPLKLLKKFKAEQEWVLGPGDMLYLPPRYAHRGTAVTPCITYSIGFRAPSAQELAQEFLVYLQDQIALPGMYADPQLQPQTHAGEIGAAMLKQVSALLKNIRWNDADVLGFLGGYLTEPKAHVFFDPPARAMDSRAFFAQARNLGLQLGPKTQMLFSGNQFFINGETFMADAGELPLLMQLADTRRLYPAATVSSKFKQRLGEWYNLGYIKFIQTVDG